jgi:hypothetical protein
MMLPDSVGSDKATLPYLDCVGSNAAAICARAFCLSARAVRVHVPVAQSCTRAACELFIMTSAHVCLCVVPSSCRGSTELIQHPNGAAPTCHTVFAVDRGCPWEKAKKLLDEEVSTSSACFFWGGSVPRLFRGPL